MWPTRGNRVCVRLRTEIQDTLANTGHSGWYIPALAFSGLRKSITQHGRTDMNLHLSLAPIIALLAGILILAQPKLLNYIVAIYLIIIGLLGIFGGTLNLH